VNPSTPQNSSEQQNNAAVAKLGIFTLYGGQALWFPVLALTALGLLFVYSSSSVYAAQKYGDEYLFFKKQLLFLAPALLAGFIGMRIPFSVLDKFVGRIFLITLIATLLTRAPIIGKKVLGAARWIQVGGFQIQPSEFLKIAAVLFASYLLAKNPRKIAHLWPIPLALGALLVQPDFGTTLILIAGLTTLIFMHGVPYRYFLVGAAAFLPILVGIMIAAPYRMRRLAAFLDPFADPLGSGFQVIQSFVAIANGGLLGRGLGGSQQKLFFLPEAHTDFILAVIAEETGFAGVIVVGTIYALLFVAIIQLLRKVKTHRERLLGSGIFAMLAASTLINMGVVAGLLPTKGLPLPFVSSGGSSLLASFFMMGLLSQIYRNTLLANASSKDENEAKDSSYALEHIPNLKVRTDV
jgi:cell division protein FtsW